jgi:uncharacterized membrane protein YtjA (UPF0391 family)
MEDAMLEWFVLLAIVAGIASVLGFGSLAATVAGLAKIALIVAALVGVALLAVALVRAKHAREQRAHCI